MANYTANEILVNLNEQGILTREDYTFIEYVEQLVKFQEATAKLVIGEENAHLVRMTEVVSRCEAIRCRVLSCTFLSERPECREG